MNIPSFAHALHDALFGAPQPQNTRATALTEQPTWDNPDRHEWIDGYIAGRNFYCWAPGPACPHAAGSRGAMYWNSGMVTGRARQNEGPAVSREMLPTRIFWERTGPREHRVTIWRGEEIVWG